MVTCVQYIINTYTIFERINLTLGPSGLYATIHTKIIERNTREKNEHSVKMERRKGFKCI